jgi:hypothetical protein
MRQLHRSSDTERDEVEPITQNLDRAFPLPDSGRFDDLLLELNKVLERR